MIRSILWKKLFILFILTIGLIFSSKIEADPVSGDNESINNTKQIQKVQDEWYTNYSSFQLTTYNLSNTLNAGQNYTLSTVITCLYLSPNVSRIEGIKLELRFTDYLTVINYSPILFNSINKTISKQTGSTRITLPQTLNATGDPSKHETKGLFQYIFDYYFYMNNDTIYHVSNDWYSFEFVTVKNLNNQV